MRRALALVITVGLVTLTVRIAAGGGVGRPTALALGFALIAAALTGALFEHARLPRVSGYLVFGMVCGPYVANILTQQMARDLQLVNGLAIALIALIAGLELNYERLKPRLATMTRFGAWIVALMYAVMVPLLWFAWPALPLIAWMVWTRGRGFNGGLAQPSVQIPGVLALVIYANLLVMPEPNLAESEVGALAGYLSGLR